MCMCMCMRVCVCSVSACDLNSQIKSKLMDQIYTHESNLISRIKSRNLVLLAQLQHSCNTHCNAHCNTHYNTHCFSG